MIHASAAKIKPIKHKKILFAVIALIVTLGLSILLCTQAQAAEININLDPDATGTSGMGTLQVVFLFTLLAVAPSLLLMTTCFTRIIIVFSLLRNAIGVTQTPPNQVLVALALMLSLFIMSPVLNEISDVALTPYMNGQISQEVAINNAERPLKEFMTKQIKAEDLNLFLSMTEEGQEIQELNPEMLAGLSMRVVIPAFITSELRRAFIMGFLLFLPFLVIDMIVSSTLMSMGMVMLPPSMISLPFKLMLFVIVDGWGLIIKTLVMSFN